MSVAGQRRGPDRRGGGQAEGHGLSGGVIRMRRAATIAALAAALAFSGEAAAEDAASFYAGKSIELVIGYPPAGSNDIYGRIAARHLGKYIPGHPSIIVRNMPGAGSLVAANHIYNRAPKDGTVLGVVSAGIPLPGPARPAASSLRAGQVLLGRPHPVVVERHHGVAHVEDRFA